MESARAPQRPSKGLSSGATRPGALRRADGPLVGFRRASRTSRPAATRMGCVGPARRFHALRALASRRVSTHCCADGPPCAFRFPAEACRSTPAPSRDPEGFARRTMLPSLGFCAPRRLPERRIRCLRGVQPRSVPRPRFGHLPRGVHHRPSGGLAAPERPRASPFEAFSSVRSDSLSGVPALLPLLASIRLAPIGACGRDRLQGLAPGRELVRSVAPLRARRVDASLGFFPSERSPPPSSRALHGFAPAPPPRVGRDDVPTRLRLEVLRSGGIGLPLSGPPALLGFATFQPSRRHREPRRETGSWFRLTARGVYAPRADLSLLAVDSTEALASA